MIKIKVKKPIIFISAAVVAAAVAAVLFFLLRPKAVDPKTLLADANTLSEQNLCLMTLLQQEPKNEEYLRQLLLNYQILGADPLTIEATRQDKEIILPETVEVAPEEPGDVVGIGGLVQNGIKITDYEDAGELATDGDTVYLAKQDGIYAHYHGLEVKISPVKAEGLVACRNGLYFLNTTAKRVQYLARDGHRTEVLSTVPAADFVFIENTLWVAGTDGALYKGSDLVEPDLQFKELTCADGRLYAGTVEGLATVSEEGTEVLLPSPVTCITGGNGVVYYVDENGYPARFDPQKSEAVILKEKTATAIGFDRGHAYYLNAKGKIKRL